MSISADQKGKRSAWKRDRDITCPLCKHNAAEVDYIGILRCWHCRSEADLRRMARIHNFAFLTSDFIKDLQLHNHRMLADELLTAHKNVFTPVVSIKKQ